MANTTLATNYFSLHNANQFVESITEAANSTYYVFAAKHRPYSSGDTSIDEIIETNDSINVNIYKEAVFGKKVTSNDVKILISRHDWVTNTVYVPYRSNTNLTNAQFYVLVDAQSEYYVFKCLDNNFGATSTVAPSLKETSADDTYYETSDGYVWKYMYSIDRTTYNKFSTENFIPVVPNANVSGNASPGAIDFISIEFKGSNYNSYLAATFSSTDIAIGGDRTHFALPASANSDPNHYNGCVIYIASGTGAGQLRKIGSYNIIGSVKRIELTEPFDTLPDATSSYEITPSVFIYGDGTNCSARALVNAAAGNSIYKIQVLNRGVDYTWAVGEIIGNTGATGSPANACIIVPVIGPKGGHGSNPAAELYGKSVGISVTFANNESNRISVENDYRQIGLIKNPLFDNVQLTIDNAVGSFQDNEQVVQTSTGASGYVKDKTVSTLMLTNVYGTVSTGYIVTGQTSGATANVTDYDINNVTKNFETFENLYKYVYATINGLSFQEDEQVYQANFLGSDYYSNAFFHSSNGSVLNLTNKRGILNTSNTITGQNSGAIANIQSVVYPDIVEGSGEVLYIENVDPIPRSNLQSETIKLILQF